MKKAKESITEIIKILDNLYQNINVEFGEKIASNSCTFIIKILMYDKQDNVSEYINNLYKDSNLLIESEETLEKINYKIIQTLDTIIDILDKSKSYNLLIATLNKLIEDKTISLNFD